LKGNEKKSVTRKNMTARMKERNSLLRELNSRPHG
jgi:hypothetical protein